MSHRKDDEKDKKDNTSANSSMNMDDIEDIGKKMSDDSAKKKPTGGVVRSGYRQRQQQKEKEKDDVAHEKIRKGEISVTRDTENAGQVIPKKPVGWSAERLGASVSKLNLHQKKESEKNEDKMTDTSINSNVEPKKRN
jgi:hypothetical protein